MEPVNVVTKFISDPEVALLLISYVFAILAFYKGWVVPKFIFDKSEERADKATSAGEKVTDALESLTTEIRQRREP